MDDQTQRLRVKFRELTNAVRANRLQARVKKPEPAPAEQKKETPAEDIAALEAMLKGG